MHPKEPPSEVEISKVGEWFRVATTGQPYRPRNPRIPSRPELVLIAAEVTRLKRRLRERQVLNRRRDEMTPSELRERKRVQMTAGIVRSAVRRRETRRALARPFRELKTALASAEREGLPEELLDLIEAMRAAERQIDIWAPAQGRRPGMVDRNRAATVLRGPVGRALRSVGLPASNGPTSPLVKVVGAALAEVYGADYDADTISSCLKRAQSRGKNKSNSA
jgi:hypothetical protein